MTIQNLTPNQSPEPMRVSTVSSASRLDVVWSRMAQLFSLGHITRMKTIVAILLTLIATIVIGVVLPVLIPLIVVGTSIWVFVDANKKGVKAGQVSGLKNMGTVGWFFACLLFWIIAFPYYVTVRDQLGQARKKCPQCLGVVPDGARKCMHCGGDLVVPVVEQTLPVVKQPPRDSTIEEYERWKKSQEL